jgi:hypothetical protein
MDTTNIIIQLCIAGNWAEFEYRSDDVRSLYQQAWEAASADK